MNPEVGILIVNEVNDDKIHNVSFELLNKAAELNKGLDKSINCLVLSGGEVELEELCFRGADVVYSIEDSCLVDHNEMLYTQNIIKFLEDYPQHIILIGATHFGRCLAPRIAATLKTGLTADCTDLVINETSEFIQIRPAFSENILAHIKTIKKPPIATVRYKEFEEAKADYNREVNIYKLKPYITECNECEIVKVFRDNDFDITKANVIVAGGRGIRKKEDMTMLDALAKLLGGETGASRALVDCGLADSSRQIGYSGNRVKPEIYIACGISGAPQHLAGMKEAQKIIAINSDPEAPIFKICDYGYVGDLYDIVPKIIKILNKGE